MFEYAFPLHRQGSPLEAHLRTQIANRGKDLLKLYTGQALRALGKFAELKKGETVEVVKKVKLRAALQVPRPFSIRGLGFDGKGAESRMSWIQGVVQRLHGNTAAPSQMPTRVM